MKKIKEIDKKENEKEKKKKWDVDAEVDAYREMQDIRREDNNRQVDPFVE